MRACCRRLRCRPAGCLRRGCRHGGGLDLDDAPACPASKFRKRIGPVRALRNLVSERIAVRRRRRKRAHHRLLAEPDRRRRELARGEARIPGRPRQDMHRRRTRLRTAVGGAPGRLLRLAELLRSHHLRRLDLRLHRSDRRDRRLVSGERQRQGPERRDPPDLDLLPVAGVLRRGLGRGRTTPTAAGS